MRRREERRQKQQLSRSLRRIHGQRKRRRRASRAWHLPLSPPRWREAIEPLQRAISLDPNKAAAHYQLGETYNQTDPLQEALDAYETAARLQPENWRAMKGIGIVLDRMGKPEAATAAYQRAKDAQRR